MLAPRKLGFWETACKFGHDFFAGTSNIVARANFKGKLKVSHAREVIKILYQRHPQLRAVIKEEKRELFFYFNDNFLSIPFVVIGKIHDLQWQECVEQEMGQQFACENYLWRTTLLYSTKDEQHELIICFHHAIADGLSSAKFIDEFLYYYQQIEQGILPTIITLKQLNAIEAMLTQKNEWSNFLKHKNNIKEKQFDNWQFHQFEPLRGRATRNIYTTLKDIELSQLRNHCKKESTTINSALNAALLLTAQRLSGKMINSGLHTPVNLRNFCQPSISSEHIGCYISMVLTVHQEISRDSHFWQLARSYRNQLMEVIPHIGFCPSDFCLINFDIAEIVDLFDMPGSTKRPYFNVGFGLTNIGEIKFAQTCASLKLDEFMFSTNHVMGEYVIFLNVVTMNNKMYFCFSYIEPLISRDWAQAFVSTFLKIIKNL